MGNYTTTAAVRAFKINGAVVDLSAYTNDEIDAEITLAEAAIEAICGDIFYTKAETNLFDGNGLSTLFFQPDPPYPLLSITTCKNLDIDGTTVLDTYVEGDDYVAYDYYIQVAFGWSDDSPRRRIGRGGVWPRGQQNIQIVGTWGRASTPAEITRAAILMVLERLKPGSTKMILAGVQKVTWDDFAIEYDAGFKFGQQTGIPLVDQMLSRYLNFSSMFQAVPDKKQTFDNPRW